MVKIIEIPVKDYPSVPPLFIVGMPRSGTKLLRSLLNMHPRICINGIETEFLPYLVHHWMDFGDLSDIECFRVFYDRITRLPYFMYRADNGSMLDVQEWHDACREYTPAGVFEALVRLDNNIPFDSYSIWGDKSPSYINHLNIINFLYPNARIIHIIRDVRDYCLSINKAWGKDMLRAAQRWADDIDAARATSKESGANYMEVHYEELLSDTESVLRQICTFLGIDFDPVMLTLDKPSENIGDAAGMSHVISDNLNKFLKTMNPRLLTRIEALAGETLTACGYKLTQPPQQRTRLSAVAMRFAQLRDAWNLVQFKNPKRGLLGAARFYYRYFMATHV
jgi:hypothetical protein